jgi:para-nitrobenzyl esterase
MASPLFRPVVDGWLLPQGYAATWAAQSQNHVTYVAGNNKDETGAVPETAFERLRTNPPPLRAGMPQTNVTLADYTASARRKFGAMADRFLALYPAANDAEAAIQNDAAARDCSRVSTFLWGQLWSKGSPLPVYTYFWTHALPGPGHDMRGAYHGSEIAYAFNSLDAVNQPWTPQDRQIAETMSAYWANIIAKGDPNGPGLPTWPRYDPAAPQVMELGDHFAPMVAPPEKIAFWKAFFESQPQW